MTDIKAKIIVISISVLHRWKTRYAFDIEHFTIYGCDLLFLTLLSINIRIWRKWWENVKSLVLMSQYYRKERMVIEIYKLVHLVNGQNYCWIIEQLSLLQSPPPHPNKFSLSIIEYVEHGGGVLVIPRHFDRHLMALPRPYPMQNPGSVPAYLYVGVNSSSNKQMSRPCNSILLFTQPK